MHSSQIRFRSKPLCSNWLSRRWRARKAGGTSYRRNWDNNQGQRFQRVGSSSQLAERPSLPTSATPQAKFPPLAFQLGRLAAFSLTFGVALIADVMTLIRAGDTTTELGQRFFGAARCAEPGLRWGLGGDHVGCALGPLSSPLQFSCGGVGDATACPSSGSAVHCVIVPLSRTTRKLVVLRKDAVAWVCWTDAEPSRRPEGTFDREAQFLGQEALPFECLVGLSVDCL